MDMKDKVAALGEHHSIKGFDKMKSLNEKIEAIKKASGKSSMTEAYDAAFPVTKKVETISGQVEKPKGQVQVIPPTASSVAHKVDVGAPVFNVNVPPPTVTVQHGSLTWSHLARQTWLWVNGFVMGSLAAALLFMAKAASNVNLAAVGGGFAP